MFDLPESRVVVENSFMTGAVLECDGRLRLSGQQL